MTHAVTAFKNELLIQLIIALENYFGVSENVFQPIQFSFKLVEPRPEFCGFLSCHWKKSYVSAVFQLMARTLCWQKELPQHGNRHLRVEEI